MVFVGDKKYACETCIKGHRSSTCKHTDRPLFEIKKKGRPVTQCEHCRELRKTRQVHVKCVCEHKDDVGEGPSRGAPKVPVSAAFPAGLSREAMEASVATQLYSEGSDSERSSALSTSGCNCQSIGSCNCCTPRVPVSRRLSKTQARRTPAQAEGNTIQPDDELAAPVSRPAGLVDLANTGGHRPVLPRPSSQRPPSPTSTSSSAHRASPSSHPSPHPPRHHNHNLYSPYGRAYEYAHGVEASGPAYHPSSTESSVHEPSPTSMSNGMFDRPDDTAWADLGPSFFENSMGSSGPNLCSCGPNCSCPACVIHRGPTFDSTAPYDACNNPGACFACANCGLFNPNLPTSPAALSNDQLAQLEFPEHIDDWLRQLSSMLDNAPGASEQPQQQQQQSQQQYTQTQQPSNAPPTDTQQSMPFNPALWQSYALWSNLQNQAAQASPAPEECCGGRCKCPAGMCLCAADCCGCCQGCQCPECSHEEGDRTVTFAVSGERQSCCGPSNHGHHRRRSPPSGGAGGSGSGSTSYGQGGQGHNVASSSSSHSQSGYFGQWSDPSLTTHRATVSRASSTSSRTSGSVASHSPTSSEYDYAAADPQVLSSCCSGLQNISTSGSPQPPAQIPSSSSSVPAAYDRSSPTFSDPSTQFRTLSSQPDGYDIFYSS
ncbi:hypothetical protein QCA50_013434 [Cerrena zonata]|uniref:Copper-fist domain-containing protein n=1 Tax=Cerrena zonata TaxID=2478898 RepID=A0AAW0G1T2_9APHY